MSEREESHDSHVDQRITLEIINLISSSEEVVFKESATGVDSSTASPAHTASPQMVTTADLQDIIDGWKTKFHQLSEGIRAIQLASEKFNAHMENLQRDSRAREGAQERRIQDMQEGLARFLERCDPAHLTAARPFESPCAPVMSTPFTPSGAPSRLRPDFNFESPVNQSTPTESTHGNRDHHYNERPTHEDDHGNSGDAQRNPGQQQRNE